MWTGTGCGAAVAGALSLPHAAIIVVASNAGKSAHGDDRQ
jgi:hypothetical protein